MHMYSMSLNTEVLLAVPPTYSTCRCSYKGICATAWEVLNGARLLFVHQGLGASCLRPWVVRSRASLSVTSQLSRRQEDFVMCMPCIKISTAITICIYRTSILDRCLRSNVV